MGNVAPTPSRNPNLSKELRGFFEQNNLCFWIGFSCCYRSKKARSPSSDYHKALCHSAKGRFSYQYCGKSDFR